MTIEKVCKCSDSLEARGGFTSVFDYCQVGLYPALTELKLLETAVFLKS